MSLSKSRRDFLKRASLLSGAALLSACAPQAANPDAQKPAAEKPVEQASEPTAAAPAAAEPVAMTVLFHYMFKDWDQRIKPFMDLHPEFEITPLDTQDDDEFVQKLTTMVAGGTPPDIAKVTGGRLIATADKGIYEDLGPHIQATPLFQRIWSQLPDEGKELRYCGKQVAIPFNVDTRLWFYNQDLFEKNGVDAPTLDWTWDDMVSIGTKMTKEDENQWFASLPIGSFQDYSEWLWQAGTTLFSADGMQVNLSTPEGIVAAQFLADLFLKHHISPSPSLKLGDIGVSFDSGMMAMQPGNLNNLSEYLGEDSTWNFKWSALFAPKGPGGDNGFVKSDGWTMLKDAKNKEAGWTFIDWYMDDDAQRHLAGMGEAVARTDIRNEVWLTALPDHLKPAIERMGEKARGLERNPGWSVAQKAWKQEFETIITGNVPVQQAMETADKKAEADIAELMSGLCVN